MQETQNVDRDHEKFLKLVAERSETIRLRRSLSLREMVVTYGYHDSTCHRIEREGAGEIQSLLRICKAFDVTRSQLLDGLGLYPKRI